MRTIIFLAALCLAAPADAQRRGNWQTDYVGDRYQSGRNAYRPAPADHWGRARSAYFRGLASPPSRVTTNPNYFEPAYVEPVMIYNPFVVDVPTEAAPAPEQTRKTFNF